MGGTQETHENQGGVEIFIASSHVLGVVLHCLPFVHAACVEIELWICHGVRRYHEDTPDRVYLFFYLHL